jgi:UDP-N-acetyl-D-mannosaminuronic acid dehydrogenase
VSLELGRKPYDAAATDAEQREAFRSGEYPVAVYGLGKMGLPLAAVYADVTGNTVGVDVDETVVEAINDAECHVSREPGLPDLVADVVERGAFRAETDGVAAASEAAIHVLMVPTLLTDEDEPDLSMLDAAVETIGQGLDPGDLVIVESTVPPRTTADRVVPRLASVSGLDPEEFGAAACPERTVSGQALADVRGTHPKIVGGVDDESTRVAGLVYGEITSNDVIQTTDAATAEAVKVFEGVYRDVNIALANQLALFAEEMEIDVTEAIDVANTQPFCEIHDPGPGVGGHCIPVYPYFLDSAFDADAPLLRTARNLNDRMPLHTVELLHEILSTHGIADPVPRVLLLGLTYKANIAELRNAPALEIADLLADTTVAVGAVDPLLDDWSEEPPRAELDGVEHVPLTEVHDRDPDAVVVVTPHDEFAEVDLNELDAPVLDGRDALDTGDVDAPVYSVGGRWP